MTAYTDAEKIAALERMRVSVNPFVRAIVERNLEAAKGDADLLAVIRIMSQVEGKAAL